MCGEPNEPKAYFAILDQYVPDLLYDKSLIDWQGYTGCFRITSTVLSAIQGHRVLETEWLPWLTSRGRPHQRSRFLFLSVSVRGVIWSLSDSMSFRAMACAVFSVATALTASFIPAAIFQSLSDPALLCILGSHMFFNVKEAAEHGVNVGTNWSSYSHSVLRSMHFADPQNGPER